MNYKSASSRPTSSRRPIRPSATSSRTSAPAPARRRSRCSTTRPPTSSRSRPASTPSSRSAASRAAVLQQPGRHRLVRHAADEAADGRRRGRDPHRRHGRRDLIGGVAVNPSLYKVIGGLVPAQIFRGNITIGADGLSITRANGSDLGSFVDEGLLRGDLIRVHIEGFGDFDVKIADTATAVTDLTLIARAVDAARQPSAGHTTTLLKKTDTVSYLTREGEWTGAVTFVDTPARPERRLAAGPHRQDELARRQLPRGPVGRDLPAARSTARAPARARPALQDRGHPRREQDEGREARAPLVRRPRRRLPPRRRSLGVFTNGIVPRPPDRPGRDVHEHELVRCSRRSCSRPTSATSFRSAARASRSSRSRSTGSTSCRARSRSRAASPAPTARSTSASSCRARRTARCSRSARSRPSRSRSTSSTSSTTARRPTTRAR